MNIFIGENVGGKLGALVEVAKKIAQSIADGLSDGKLLADAVVAAMKPADGEEFGVLFAVKRDSKGSPVIDDVTKEVIKVPLTYGRQIHESIMQVYSEIAAATDLGLNTDPDSMDYREFNGIARNAAERAMPHLGVLRWSPKSSSTVKRTTLKSDDDAAKHVELYVANFGSDRLESFVAEAQSYLKRLKAAREAKPEDAAIAEAIK